MAYFSCSDWLSWIYSDHVVISNARLSTHSRSHIIGPRKDPLGAGYHILQSKIAIGSGGLSGKGWMQGTQSQLEFCPNLIQILFCGNGRRARNDWFLILMAIYLFIIVRGLMIAVNAQTSFGRILAGATTLIFFVYVFVNIGMVSGILPVVGVPLPLFSYGGTSYVAIMASFGLLMSIHTHKSQFMKGANFIFLS